MSIFEYNRKSEFKKIFIVGSGRSGTHWLRRILGSNPKVVDNDYESSIYKVILGPFINSKMFWNRSWKTVKKNFDASHLDKWVTKEQFEVMINNLKVKKGKNTDKARELINTILTRYYFENYKSDSDILVEKSPGHVFYVEEILKQFSEAKVIEIVRDGRDVCMSLDKLYKRNVPWVPETMHERISLWQNALKPCKEAKLKQEFKNRILTVKYESLISNFNNSVLNIYNFCKVGLDNESFQKIIDENKKNIVPRSEPENWQTYYDSMTRQWLNKNLEQDLIALGYLLN